MNSTTSDLDVTKRKVNGKISNTYEACFEGQDTLAGTRLHSPKPPPALLSSWTVITLEKTKTWVKYPEHDSSVTFPESLIHEGIDYIIRDCGGSRCTKIVEGGS